MADRALSIIDDIEYQQWLHQLIAEIDRQRLKAAMQLNAATLQHCNDIIRKQKEHGWGAKVIDQLSVDLQKRYDGDSGYSIRNQYVRQFADEYPDFPFVQVPLAQIQKMPFLQARLAKFTVSADGQFVQVPLAQITYWFMIICKIPNKPRRGLISTTPDKKIFDFRSIGR